ncbi:hypothetical protein [Phocaeicola sp.]
MKQKILLMALLVTLPSINFAQNELDELAKSTKELIGLFKKNKKTNNIQTENGETFETGIIGEAIQQRIGSFKLVTNHPDFKIKVRRCEASGKTCVIDLILENIGSQDVDISLYSGFHGSIAYDDEANQYHRENLKIILGSSGFTQDWHNGKLLSNVPMKARIQIENVPESATVFRRLDLNIGCKAWNIGGEKKVKFLDLPISREGDE